MERSCKNSRVPVTASPVWSKDAGLTDGAAPWAANHSQTISSYVRTLPWVTHCQWDRGAQTGGVCRTCEARWREAQYVSLRYSEAHLVATTERMRTRKGGGGLYRSGISYWEKQQSAN